VPTEDFAQLQLRFVDQTQWRYEVIRPLVLFADHTAQQRSQETQTHPATVRKLTRSFQQQGMLGLLPANVEVTLRGRTPQVPEAVRQEVDRLKALYDGFHYRELARILFVQLGYTVDDKTIKKLWQESPVSCQGHLGLWEYHAQSDRYQARVQVIKLYYQGWEKISISRFLKVSRPTVDAWIRRFETEQFAGLLDKSRAPQAPVRKIWLPLMVQVYHLQKAHPDAGEFRIWSLLARPDISVRTIGRVMALNRLVYDDIPHVPKKGVKPTPGPHPYKASYRHHYWFIDGRQMDFALDGVRWWSLIILEGYSRTILAGAIAPTGATWAALMVLYTACAHYGAPTTLVSDSGGAYTSNDFEAVCVRLRIQHETIESTKGESYKNLVVTVERRITPPPAVPERRMPVSVHTAPQYPDACHAYLAGDSPLAPAFSHRGSVHEALADCCSANRGDHHYDDPPQSGRHVGRTTRSGDSARVAP
jgi:transposase InsO family protein/transposase